MALIRPKTTVGRAVVPVTLGLGFFVLLGLVLWGVAALVSNGPSVQVKLGADVFTLEEPASIAKEISTSGPLLFPGLVNGAEREAIGVYHTGDDPTTAWRVFSLVPPGAPASCVVSLDRATRELVAPCTGHRFPQDGTGLAPIPWSVDGSGHVVIDLTPGGAPGHATTPP